MLQVDVNARAKALADQYAINVPVLHRERMRQSQPQQIKIPGPWGYDGRQQSLPGIRPGAAAGLARAQALLR